MTPDFIARLAEAWATQTERDGDRAPAHYRDQVEAASREARAIHGRAAVTLPLLAPDHGVWYWNQDPSPSGKRQLYLTAAILGCAVTCSHLRRGGPQPAFARLALGRIDCQRCL